MQFADGELKKLLVSSGKVKPDVLDDLLKDQKDEDKAPLQTLVLKHKLVNEKDLLELYAGSIDVPLIDLSDIDVPREILTKIPERIARKYQAVLFGTEEDHLQLAMADPEDFQAVDFISKQIGASIKVYLAPPADILAVIDQYKGNISSEITKAIKDSSANATPVAEAAAKELTDDAPIAKTVNVILEFAVKARASDIHIEPREDIVQVRCRVDGILRETMTLPRPILAAVVSRIKILANLKIDEHRVAQDGRFKFTLGSKVVALRVSTLPVMDGEKVVMRILDESTRALTLEELGFEGPALEAIGRNLHKPHGMTLVTGPTGSGKSTTLYSVLNLLNSPMVNISTIEDPVEYRIPGVNQTQVNPKGGMTFAAGLRALLRQDPNIIMVGEIRDGETADLAVQAALTGHVVLSTLHTNNASTTLPRLLDMGVEPFLIASTVNSVIGQRLVRRLCASCRIPYVPNSEEIDNIKQDFELEAALKHYHDYAENKKTPVATEAASEKPPEEAHGNKTKKVIEPTADIELSKSILDKIASDPNIINRPAADTKAKADSAGALVAIAQTAPSATAAPAAPIDESKLKRGEFVLYKPGAGCNICGGSDGYQGRLGVHEVLEVTDEIAKMIVSRATSEDIQSSAVSDGMLTMQQDGFVKALSGLTTIEEVLRVTRE